MAERKTRRAGNVAAAKAKRAVRSKTRTATGKKVKDTRERVRKATRNASRSAGRAAKREATGKNVGDRLNQRLEKRIARLEDRLGKEPKTDVKPTKVRESRSKETKMAELRAMRSKK
jgi:hypothetical protein